MTSPRQVLPGTTYLVTRRCSQRQFLLSPSPLTNQVFGYVLAVATQRFGIQLHAFCVLSNHFHLLLTDPHARLPAFEQFLNALVARALNAALGRWESFWAPSSYSAVALLGPDDVIAKSAYVLANPVAAGLVRRGRMWPGLWSGPARLRSGQLELQRPSHFFSADGQMPQTATLALTPPPRFDDQAYQAAVAAALAAEEDRLAADLSAAGLSFVGAARVMAQRPNSRPLPDEPRRRLSPKLACRDKWKRIEALGRLMDFLHAYRRAWKAWRSGATGVVFPAGTYLLRVVCGVPCAAPG
jgi:REP element-mobilizing transposase RayT